MSRPIGGQIRSATVSRKGGHWCVSLLILVLQGREEVKSCVNIIRLHLPGECVASAGPRRSPLRTIADSSE
ncbi:hypothetical protein GCM10022205_28710 [Spinactinospora alkalitolerans]